MFESFLWVLSIGAVLAGAVLLVRALRVDDRNQTTGPSALDLLRERFARGEIGPDEFEERRAVLTS